MLGIEPERCGAWLVAVAARVAVGAAGTSGIPGGLTGGPDVMRNHVSHLACHDKRTKQERAEPSSRCAANFALLRRTSGVDSGHGGVTR
jgi:hypothetical protein